MIQYVANLVGNHVEPVEWARRREAEGWHGVGVADHLWAGTTTFPHWAVTLGQIAAVTERVTIQSCFANNLLRSPVEYAQAALTLQRASNGRFEAGLGAGWARQETEGSGLRFPSAGERVERYVEAITIVRQLLTSGNCNYSGAHYEIDVPCLGPTVDRPPPLIIAAGGPRSIREAAPLADRVELTFNAAATRNGDLRPERLSELGREHLEELIDMAERAAPSVPRGIFLTVACGRSAVVTRLRDTMALGIGGLAGSPDEVAATVRSLVDHRIDRVQLTPATPETLDLLAPLLPLGGRP